jgi:PhnB protein
MTRNNVAPIPPGPRLIPFLTVRDIRAALDFYTRAFEARELYRLLEPGDLVGHAEFTLAGGTVMLGREWPEGDALSPETRGGPTAGMTVYVEDVDAFTTRAVAAGARLERPVADQFYGDRVSVLRDPFGHRWSIHTRIEEVTPEEMQRRLTAMMSGS